MKKCTHFFMAVLSIAFFSSSAFAQVAPIDFESGGNGANWTWTVFENDTNPALEVIANPDMTGANTSATVAKFTALQTGQPFAGVESMHGSDIGTFTLDATNSVVKVLVWKPVISDVGVKFARPDGGALPEIKVANTVVNQWEELTFDFTGRIGEPITIDQDQIIIFMDFNARTSDNVCYFDNVTFSGQTTGSGPSDPAPTPTIPASDVISVFSDAYTNIAGTDLNPNWGQATIVTEELIGGNNTLLYTGLNYQGIQLGSNQDVSAMSYLHLDFWTDNSTDLGVFLISPGPVEIEYLLVPPGPTGSWVSVDIPLSVFAPVDLADVFQFKFDGDGDIYLDNIYFSTTPTGIEQLDTAVPSDYALEQNYPNPFNPTTNIRFNLPQSDQVALKVYNMLGQEVATLVNGFLNQGSYVVDFDATDLPSGIYVYAITAGDYVSTKKMMLIK
ncbi:MAG: T9SS type A sorting domain-containing protein [Calditrichia bacterium]